MCRALVAPLAIFTVIGSAPAALAQCAGGYTPTCSLTKAAPVIFLGSIESINDGTFHFRVEERFAGVKGSTIDIIDIAPVEGSTGYDESVKRYLVFAQTVRFDDGREHAYVGGCGRQMIPFPGAGPDLEQLRRQKRGRRVAAAYGTLVRTMYESSSMWDPGDAGALPDVVLRFQSNGATVTAKTRSDGTFVVERLPKGTYRITADLPVGLKLGYTILDEPFESIEVESGTCYDLTLTAVPTAKISGRVIGPDGRPRDGLRVNLFRADDPSRGMDAWQGDGKPFEFTMIPPGDYVLAFGNGKPHPLNPDHPFPDTFYPSAPDIAGATVIHLGPGQQILNADIHLPTGRPTRTLEIVLNWNGMRAADTYGAFVTATTSDSPGTRRAKDGGRHVHGESPARRDLPRSCDRRMQAARGERRRDGHDCRKWIG
ncbi:MAG TPA: carboxypeptidase-like regulatory domain-containing protein [Vicinamibacterales bacterium]|jgi:hypothetical protein|nr:carboxypeptidase-like regulatory domain-containing protein [Vicinamibacterales bacterium]